MFLYEAAVPLLVAGFVSVCLTPFAMKLGVKLDIIDRPNERKVSRREQIPLSRRAVDIFWLHAGAAVFVESEP